MSDAIAARVDEAGVIPKPNVDLTVQAAYRAVKDLCKPDVLYELRFDDCDSDNEGNACIFKRFSRTHPAEVWLIAMPVDLAGRTRRDEQPIVCPMAFNLRPQIELAGLQGRLVNELAALVRDDA